MEGPVRWVPREYRQGDETQIIPLFNSSFNASRSVEKWRWEFRDNPVGIGLSFVADDGGKIVGHFGAIPVRWKCGDQTILGAQSVDGFTHPDYRLQGMFVKLAKTVHDEAIRSGVSLIWAFPNQSSYPAFMKKLGFREIATVPGLMLMLDTKRLLRPSAFVQYLRSGLLFRNWRIVLRAAIALIYHPKPKGKTSDILVNRVNAFDTRVDVLWQNASARFRLSVARSSEYLNWRYAKNPDGYAIFVAESGNQLLGFIVLRVGDPTADAGAVVDILTLPNQEPVVQELVDAAVDFFRSQRVSVVYSYILDEEYYRALSKCGFRAMDSRLVLAIRTNLPIEAEHWFADPKSWHIAFGDSDGI